MSHQKGFTLIELVAVIVILGALAVVALPRFVDLQDEAERAAAEGVAGALSAASATNYAAFLADGDFEPVESVNDLPDIMQNGDELLPDGSGSGSGPAPKYDTTGCSVGNTDTGKNSDCELTRADGSSFNPKIIFNVIPIKP